LDGEQSGENGAVRKAGVVQMELRHFRYFIAVAEELSFTRAAERLGIKQPPLSLQIRQLEKDIGTTLFYRHARRVELSGAGKLLLEETRDILERVERARTDVGRRARGETGKMWIGAAAATYLDPLVVSILREFTKKYPGLVLFSEEQSSQALIARVHAGNIDVAFTWSPASDAEHLAVIPLGDQNSFVMLPEGHKLSRKPVVALIALAKEKFFLPARHGNARMYDSFVAACRLAGFEPDLNNAAPHVLAIFPVVAAGLGISIVPRCMTRFHFEGVSFRPIDSEALHWPMNLIYRRSDRSAAVRNLVTLAKRMVRYEGRGVLPTTAVS